jgi:hypothetical protein
VLSATVTLGNLSQTYNGASRTVTVTTAPVGLNVVVTYNGSVDLPTNAGSYAVTGTVSEVNYLGTTNETLVVGKADQGIAFPSPGDQLTTNVVTLSATATSGLSVAFAVISGPGTIGGGTTLTFTNAGSVSIEATQAGDSNWNAAPPMTNTIAATKATAGVSLNSLSQTYNGAARTVTATTTPGGLAVDITYDGSGTAPTSAGSYAVTGTVSAAEPMYQGMATGTLVVGAKTLTAVVSLNNKVYDGTTDPATIASRSLTGVVGLDDVSLGTSGTVGTFSSKNVGSYSVSISALALSGTQASDYTLASSTVNSNASITALGVTVASGVAVNSKTYDGDTTATLATNGVVLSGVLALDSANVQLATNGYSATFAVATVSNGITVTVSGLTLTGSEAGNYTLTQPVLTGDITVSTVTITSGVSVNSKVYDGTTTATLATNSVVLFGVVAGDVGNVRLATNGCSATFAVATASNGIAVTVSGLSLTGSAAANYTVTQPSLTGNITVATVTITSGVTVNSKVYDGTTAATLATNSVALTGVVVGDAANVRLATNGYTATFGTAVASNGVGVTVSGLTLEGSAAANYTLAQPSLSGNITVATVTITSGVTANNKAYDGTTSATLSTNSVALSGVMGGDVSSVRLATNGYTAAFLTAAAGNGKTVTVSGLTLTGSAAGNYTLTQPTTLTANITALTVTIQSGVTISNKVYDATTAAMLATNSVVLNGVLGGDTANVKLATNGYTATFGTAVVSNGIGVTVSGLTLTGSAAGSYTLTQPGLTANITPRPVTLSGTRVYDGTREISAASLTIDNNLDDGSLTLSGTAALTGKDVGSRAVTNVALARVGTPATGSTGGSAANSFNVTVGAPTDGNTLIAVISTRGTNGNMVTNISQTGASWSRASQATNTAGVTVSIWYAPNVSNASTTVTINLASALFASASVMEYSGVLSASPVDQTASADGDSTNAVTGTTSTTAQGDELWMAAVGLNASQPVLGSIANGFSTVTNAASTSATVSTNAKVYALEKIVSASGAAASGGTLSGTVTSIVQRGAATEATTANTSLTISKPTGVVAGDVMIVTIAQLGNNTTDPTCSGWTLVDGAILRSGGTLNYGAVLYRIAGSSEPSSYTFTLGSGVTSASGAILAFSGVDTTGGYLVGGGTGGPFDAAPGTILANTGGSASVGATTLTTVSANAAVIMLGMAGGNLTWTGWTTASAGALTELADNPAASVTVGGAWMIKATAGSTGNGTSTLSNTARNGGLLVALRPATPWAGTVATFKKASTLALGGSAAVNYTLSGATGAVTITAKAVTVASGVTASNKVYDGTTAATLGTNSVSLSGVVSADSGTVSLATNGYTATFGVATVSNGVGVTVSGLTLTGSAAGNYSLTQPAGLTANITAAPVTISSGVTASNKVYDKTTTATLATNSVALSGVVAGDVAAVSLATNGYTATFGTANASNGVGVTVSGLTLTGSAAANYTLTQPSGLSANITKKPITVTAVSSSKTADGTTSSVDVPAIAPGLVSSDTSGFIQTYDTAAAGTGKTLTPSGTANDGNGGNNYSVAFVPVSTGTITPATANAYRIVAASGTPAAGANDALTITIVDQYQNVVAYTGDKSITFSGLADATSGAHPTVTDKTGATVALGTATTISFVNGTSSAGGTLVACKAEGPVTLAATDGSLTTASTGGTGASLTVSFGTASQLLVTTQPSPVTAPSTAFAQQPVVKIMDAYQNVVTSGADATRVVTATLTQGSGTLGGTVTKTAVAGVADFSGNNLSINLRGDDKVLTFTTTGGVITSAATDPFAIGTSRYAVVASGNWDVTSTWAATSGGAAGASVPVAGDAVYIGEANVADRIITIPAAYTAACVSLTLGPTGAAGDKNASLILAGTTSALDVSGDVNINRGVSGAGGKTTSLNVNNGTVTVAGNVSLSAGSFVNATKFAKIMVTNGTLNVGGNLAFTNTQSAALLVIDMSGGAGTVNLSGALSANSAGTLTAGSSSTFNFNGTSEQTVPIGSSAIVYNHLRLNNTSAGGATLSTNITGTLVTGDVTVQSGILSNAGYSITLAANDKFAVSNGATFILTGTSSNAVVSGTGSRTFGASSTVAYVGGSQTVSGDTYGNLTVSGGTKTAGGNVTVNGVLTNEATTLDMSTYQLAGSFTTVGDASSVLQVRNTSTTPIPFGKTWNCKVTYLGTGAQTLMGGTYQTASPSLQIQNNQNNTVTGDLTIAFGTLRIIGTSGVNMNGYNLTVGGNQGGINKDATATFTAGAGTVTYNRGGNQTLSTTSGVTYNNVVLAGSGIKTLPAGTAVSSNLSVTACVASVTAGTNVTVGTLTLGGTNKISGTWGSSSSTVTHTNDVYFDATTGYLIVVNDARTTPTVSSWPTASGIAYGQAVSNSTLSGGTPPVPGSFAFASPATVPNAGTYSAAVAFTPTDATSFKASTNNVSVAVAKANCAVTTWPTAAAITYGQALSNATLSGGSATPVGTFGYTTPATVPNAGVASYGVTYTPNDTVNYNTSNDTVSVTVNPRAVVLTGSRSYDATANAAFSILTVSNKVGSDTVNLASGTGVVASATVGTQAVTSVGTLVLGNNGLGNYTLSGAGGSLIISQATVTVSSGVSANNKVYDRTTAATLATNSVLLSGVLAGDIGNVILATNGYTATFGVATVSNGVGVTVSGLSLTGSAAGNYTLTQPSGLAANITPVTVTIASGVTANNKVYNGNTAATLSTNSVSLNGVIAGDLGNVILATNGYTATFGVATVSNGVGVTVSGLSLTGSAGGNYTLTQPVGLVANITLATVTIASGVTANNKVYDATTPTTLTTNSVALNGVMPGDTANVLLATNGYTANFVSASAGIGKSVTVSSLSLTGSAAGNYTLTQPGLSADITGRPVALSGSRIYDGTREMAASGLTVNNNLDDGNLMLSGTALLSGKDVSSQPITNIALTRVGTPASGSTGGSAANSFSVTVSAPTAGNTLIAVISTRGTTGNLVTSISQTGVTWTRASQATNTAGVTVSIWYAPVAAGAGTAVTINLAASLFASAVITEYSGILSGSPVDQTASASGNSTNAVTGTTAATTQNDELWIGGIGVNDSSYTVGSIQNSFSTVTSAQSSSGATTNNAKVYALERIVSTAGAASSGGAVAGGPAGITVVDSKTSTSSSASLSIAKPSGLAVGDLMIANITQRNSVIDATPSGWTTLVSYLVGSAGRWATISYKVADSADVAAGSFAFSATAATSMAGGITAFRGVDTTTTGGIEVTGAAATASSVGPIAPTQITTLTDNALVLFIAQINGAGITFTANGWKLGGSGGSAMTQAYVVYHPSLEPQAGLAYLAKATAGATGSGYETISASARWGGILLSLKPLPPPRWAGTVATFKKASTLALGGSAAGNYTLNGMSGSVTISTKALTVTGLSGGTKTYDATTNATFTGSAAFLAAEAPGSGTTADGKPYTIDAVSAGGVPAGTFADRHVGSGKAITVTGVTVTGTGNGNYTATQQTGLTGIVTTKVLTVSGITASARVYDGTTNAVLGGAAVLQTAEPVGAGSTGDGVPYDIDDVSTGGSPVGYYATKHIGTAKAVTVIGTTLSGAQATDYAVAQQTGLTADITAKPITVTAVTSSKTADGNITSTGVPTIVPSLVGADTSGFIQTYDTAAAGTGKRLTPSGVAVDGNGGNNYNPTFQFVDAGTINPAAANKLAIQTQPSGSATAGIDLVQQPIVLIQDQYGNLRINDSLTVTAIRVTGSSTLVGTTNIAAVGGVVTYTNLAYNKAESMTMLFTNSGLLSVTSSVVVVSPNAYTKLQVLLPGEGAAPGMAAGKTNAPSARIAGSNFVVTVNAVDDYWNLIGTNDTVGLTSSDANATLPANAALAGGTKSLAMTNKTAGSGVTVTVSNLTQVGIAPDTSTAYTVNPAVLAKMQLLLPGETAAPGTASGKTGTPSDEAAGVAFNVDVKAVDAYWNVVNTNNSVRLYSSDPYATLPAAAALINGAKTLVVSNRSIGTWTLTLSNATHTAIAANTSPSYTVTVGPFSRLQVLLSGETAVPGSATGKTGTPNAQTSAVPFTVTVRAVDGCWNLVNTNDTVGITSSDVYAMLPPDAPLSGGTQTFSITIKAGGSRTVTATDITDGTKTANTSASFTVNPGPFAKLLMLLPGETAVPGSATGKTGTPNAQTASAAFTVTVNGVDDNWNTVTSLTGVGYTIHPAITDPLAFAPEDADLSAGVATISVTFETAGSQPITVSDLDDGSKAESSGTVTVNTSSSGGSYRSVVSGNWSTAGTWQRWNGATWVAASTGPSASDNWITIRSPNTVSVTAKLTEDQIIVEAGGKLAVSNTLTVADSYGTDLDVYGLVAVVGSGSLVDSAGGASIIHSGGSVTSTVNVVVKGDMTVETNALLDTAPADSLQVDGSLTVNGGRVECKDFKGAGTMTVNDGVLQVFHDFKPSTPANFNAPGGTVQFSGASGGGAFNVIGTWRFHNLVIDSGINPGFDPAGNKYQITGSWTNNGIPNLAGVSVIFNGTGTQYISGTSTTRFSTVTNANTSGSLVLGRGILVSNACVVTSGSRLMMGTNLVFGPGTFTLASGGTVETGHTNGLNGNLTLSNKTLNAAGNFLYDGTAPQVTGTLLPVAVTGTVTIANGSGSGVTFSQNTAFNGAGSCVVSNGGVLSLGSSTVLSGTGAFNLTAGGTVICGNASGLNGHITTTTKTLSSAGNYTFNGAAAQMTGTLLPTTITGTVSIANGNGTGVTFSQSTMFNGAGTCVVSNGAMLTLGSAVALSGDGAFNLMSGATLAAAHAGGVDGNVSTATRTLSTSANYVFNGAVAQVTGASLPATVNNLKFDNGAGITLSGSATVNGLLTLTNGIVETGANQLTVPASATISRTSGHVNGALQRGFNTGAAQSFTFPIGDATKYAPLALSALNVSVAGNLAAKTTAGDHPQLATSGIDASRNVNRYWTLAQSGGTFGTFTAGFNYQANDLDGAVSNSLFVVRQYAGSWSTTLLTNAPTTTLAVISNQTAFGDFAIGDQLVNAVTFTQQPVDTAAGQTMAAVKVTASDCLSVGVPSVPVDLRLNSGTLYGTTNAVTDAGGVATFGTLSITQAGSGKQLTATCNGVSGTSSLFTINPAAASQLVLQTAPPASAIAGEAFVPQPVVWIEDPYGNLRTADSRTVTAVRVAGSLTLAGTTNIAAVGGVVTFTNLAYNKAETISILFTNSGLTSVSSAGIAVSPAPFAKLQVLLPGESAAAGTGSGKTGSPSAQTAGTAFNVTVNAVDDYWNVVDTNDTVAITSSDSNAALPADAPLAGGTGTFGLTLKTAGSRTVTVSDVTDGTKTADTSPAVTVRAGTFSKLQLVLPGETEAPGTVSGKTGSPSNQPAGTFFTVTVRAVDDHWNLVSTNDTVHLYSSDENAVLSGSLALSGGTRGLSAQNKTAGSQTLTVSNVTHSAITPDMSSPYTVDPGAFVKLQILMPGEAAARGTATGKTGTPGAQTAGIALTAAVYAVDTYWNVVSTNDTVTLSSSDSHAELPAPTALSAGTWQAPLTMRTVGSRTVTATDSSDGSKLASTSPAFIVNAGTFARLEVLLPGETAAPGTATGRSGTPNAQTSDVPFTVTVKATDICWNPIDTNDLAGITSSDANAVLPSDAALAGGAQTFSITLKTAGGRTVTATDLTDGAILTDTSTLLTVRPGPFAKLQVLLPGEAAAAGTLAGKTGTPDAETAGAGFSVVVHAVDANWNVVNTGDTVRLYSDDANATLPAATPLSGGSVMLDMTNRTAGSWALTVSNVTHAAITADNSPLYTVNSGAFAQLQVLLPGETAAPGSATGKSGTPNAHTTGIAFNVTVNAVDACWNLVNVTDTVRITSSDGSATLPANAPLVAGAKAFTLTLVSTGSQTVVAADLSNGGITSGTGSVTVYGLPVLSINSVTALEGADGVTNTASFTVTLNGWTELPCTFDFGTSNGTAAANSDYVAHAGTVTIPVGMTSTSLAIRIVGDDAYESNETFLLVLSNAVCGTIAPALDVGTGTIANDDPFPMLSIQGVSVKEGNAGATNSAVFVITLTESSYPVSFSFSSADGTALAGSDYLAEGGAITMAAGQTSTSVIARILGDGDYEGDETFVMNLSGALNATIVAAQGQGRILDDEVAGPASINNFRADGYDVVFQIVVTNSGIRTIISADGSPTNAWSVRYQDPAPGSSDFSFRDSGAATSTAVRFYRLLNNDGGTITTNPAMYAMYSVQTDTGKWYKLSMPVDFGASNRLDGALGEQLAQYLGGDNAVGDLCYIMGANGVWTTCLLDSNNTWRIRSRGQLLPASVQVESWQSFWIKRRNAGSNTVSVFAGPVHATPQPVTFRAGKWHMIAWPFAASRREDAGTNKGWGFAAAGARKGPGLALADRLSLGEGTNAATYYLSLSGHWCRAGQTVPATNLLFEAGKAYYYYHSGTGFVWTAREE